MSGIQRFKRKLPSFNTVRRGATATANLPVGAAYRSIDLIVKKADGTAFTEAQIKNAIKKVKLLVNGKCLYEASAKFLVDCMNRYKTLNFAAGFLHIPLTDRKFKIIEMEDLLRWGTRNVATFDIEVEVADHDDAADITIKGEALMDNISEDLGVIREVHEFSYAAPGAGKYEIADLPKYNGALAEMHFNDNGKIKEIEFKADNVVYLEGDLENYKEILKRSGERTPQAGYAHHDFCFMNRLADCFQMHNKSDIRYYLDMAEAQAIKVLMVTYNAPLGYSPASIKK